MSKKGALAVAIIFLPFAVACSRTTRTHWSAGPVIAVFWGAAEGFYTYFSSPPDSVLYADGRQILWHNGYLYEKRFSDQGMCDLLTQIDNGGFFEYTGQQYTQFYESNHMKPGPEVYLMTIRAWKTNSLHLDSFRFLYSQYKDKVEWPSGLRIPYEQLTRFDPDTMHPYVPDRVAVHIERDPQLGTDLGVRIWKTEHPALNELVDRYAEKAAPVSETSEGEIVLSGEEGRNVLQQFDNRPWGATAVFVDGKERFLVAVRALLPYEAGGGVSYPLLPDPNAEQPLVPVSCPN